MNLEAELIATVDVSDRLGEGVLWREDDRTIWWTDILGKKLHCLAWPSRELSSYDVPERIGSFSFIQGNPDEFLIAFESGIARYSPTSGKLAWLDKPVGLGDGVRMNDGRTDPQGRFWVGSMVERELRDGEPPSGILYRVSPKGICEPVLGQVSISNGLCWSPDGQFVYFSDSALGQVYRAGWDPNTGVPGQMQALKKFDGASPDGAVTDSDGMYWSALWGGNRIACLDHTGAEVTALDVPVSQPTCVAFGGPDLDLMIVTTAKEALSPDQLAEQPLAGSLLIYKTSIRGWPQVSARMADASWP